MFFFVLFFYQESKNQTTKKKQEFKIFQQRVLWKINLLGNFKIKTTNW